MRHRSAATRAPQAPEAAVRRCAPARVLVADDESTVRDTLARLLRHLGYDVTVAEDGVELLAHYDDAAVRRWPGEPVDLILSDVDMPRCDGFGVLEHLRGEHAETPVILMSGRCSPALRELALELGAVGVLAKPFTLDDLDDLIREVLATRVTRPLPH